MIAIQLLICCFRFLQHNVPTLSHNSRFLKHDLMSIVSFVLCICLPFHRSVLIGTQLFLVLSTLPFDKQEDTFTLIPQQATSAFLLTEVFCRPLIIPDIEANIGTKSSTTNQLICWPIINPFNHHYHHHHQYQKCR